MESQLLGAIGMLAFLALIMAGVPIAFSSGLVGFIGIAILTGIGPAFSVLAIVPFGYAAVYAFSVLPLFIFMGYLAAYAGLTDHAYEAAYRLVGHLPGGLAIATTISCAAFGACAGSSTAAAAVMGKVAIPEMERHGYSRKLAAGVVAAAGTFAIMIPPSAVMVVYGILADVSIGRMLLGGFIPGILSAVVYAILIWVMVLRDPKLAPQHPAAFSWRERLAAIPPTWGILLLAAIVTGGIYSGLVTSTEAAALGALAAFILALMNRLKWRDFAEGLLETGRTTTMVFAIIIGIMIFTKFMAYSQATSAVTQWIIGLPLNRYLILIGIMGLYFVLGMFFETIGMLVLTLPFVVPTVAALHFDQIWFGVLTVMMIEIGLITPPVGLNVFVVKGVAPHIPLGEIFSGIWPFVAADLVVLALMIAFPQIVMVLPNMMLKQ